MDALSLCLYPASAVCLSSFRLSPEQLHSFPQAPLVAACSCREFTRATKPAYHLDPRPAAVSPTSPFPSFSSSGSNFLLSENVFPAC